MRKFLFLLTAISVALSMWAAPVDQSAAQRKAKQYLANEMYAGQLMAPAALNPVLVKTEYGTGNSKAPVYYIFNTSSTYLVMSADDRAEEILMVGDAPLDLDRIPDGLQYLLGCYQKELSFLIDRPSLQVEKPSQKNTSLRAVTYGPLLTTMWDQDAPYYNQCKFTRNGTTYQCLTGCPATSAAMVMYYWKYPASIGALASYTGYLDIGTYSSNYVTFTYPALEATTFDWANMRDTYTNSSSSASKTAVATLMRYIGQAEKMMYGGVNVGSGISSSNSQIIATMFKNWGYKTSARLVNKSSYTETSWANLIIAEMAASRPVVYLGIDSSSGGHAFNVDGYRDSDSKYHVNFGWSGYGNNWFVMNSFTYAGDTFDENQQAIIGIESPHGLPQNPYFEVSATSLSFTAEVGETKTQTFTVSGGNLTNNINLSITGNAAFTISPTTITPTQAAAGVTVTVTYAPTAAGTQSAAIGVSCEGLTSKTITVSGTSTGGGTTPGAPTLNANPSSLTFNTEVGTPVTQTFVVTGANLTASYATLTVSGAGFSINKTTVSRSSLVNGNTITVTFNPTSSGNYSGVVTISSTGAEDETVTLTGTATAAPALTVDPTSLSFTTQVGTPVTKTFTVTGTDLTGNVSLAVNGAGFAIDKTTINKNAAAEGATVTVTYNPTAAGTHTGTVTITSAGAATKTVSLSGSSVTVPSLAVNPTALNFTALVGETKTATFTVNGENLTGPLTLTVNNGNGIYSVQPTTISAAEAAAGKTVTVTYAPTAFGVTNATVTVSGGGATAATVALAGQADLVKYAPVMLPANEDYIGLTKFRADWTDETPAANVASYTLEVTPKAVEPVAPVLLHSLSGTAYPNNGYSDISLSAPWASQSLRGGYGAMYIKNNYNGVAQGYITYTIPEGYTNATFTVMIVSANTDNGVGDMTISTPQTAAVSHNFVKNETFYWVVKASSGEKITMISTDPSYSPDMTLIAVYAGDATASMLRAFETGDENGRVVTGITDKFYTVENLAAQGTFLYRVKALYQDGTESDWSNIQEVTLFDNTPEFVRGDVTGNTIVDMDDLTALINYLLNGDASGINQMSAATCSSMDDTEITMDDITALINYLLTGAWPAEFTSNK